MRCDPARICQQLTTTPSPASWRDLPGLAILAQELETARRLHFLGPGPVEAQIEHSLAFLPLLPAGDCRGVDLGSGAGIPGLVLAIARPASTWTLVDAHRRRCEFLDLALARLDLEDRVKVCCQRAEELGRDPQGRGQANVVVARSFAGPAVTAECAAPLLSTGGTLVVAEPPAGDELRWPPAGLELLGLALDQRLSIPVSLQGLRQVEPCPERYPRRVGIPAKRPLW